LADFKNPQQEPGAEKRLLLVFLLTFVALIVFQPLLKKYMPQPPAPPAQKQPVPEQTAAAPSAVAAPAPAARGLSAKTPAITASKQASSETETVIENDLYRITFTNRGALVKSWILKKFDNDAQNGPLDLVNPAAAQKYGYPLSLWTYDETVRNKLSSALYVASSEGQLSAPAEITFEYADQDVVVRKSFRFDHTYVLNVETSVVYKGAEIFAPPAWPAAFGDQATPAAYAAAHRAHRPCLPQFRLAPGDQKHQRRQHDSGSLRVGRDGRSILHRHLYPRRSPVRGNGDAALRDGDSAEAWFQSHGVKFEGRQRRTPGRCGR